MPTGRGLEHEHEETIASAIVSARSSTHRQGCGSREKILFETSSGGFEPRFALAILPTPHFTGLAKWARGAHFL